MPLLNYTTTVSAERSIAAMQKMLVDLGARGISLEYDERKRPVGMRFGVITAYGPRTFAVPANVSRVQEVLRRQGVQPRYRTDEHAQRVAWRILKDWLEAMLAILSTEMVTIDQIMLPYLEVNGSTVYQQYVDQQLTLEAGDRR